MFADIERIIGRLFTTTCWACGDRCEVMTYPAMTWYDLDGHVYHEPAEYDDCPVCTGSGHIPLEWWMVRWAITRPLRRLVTPS